MDHQKNALQPAFALLEEIAKVEGGLLPHFALYEVEVVALAIGAHRKEAVLGHGTIQTVVEGYGFFSSHLKKT